MWSAETVLVCALALIGQRVDAVPVTLLAVPPSDVSARADGFVRDGDPRIYLITGTAAFRSAQRAADRCGRLQDLRKIASVIVHEEWHLAHPGDEAGAYQAQLAALVRTGAGPGNVLYAEVGRAMRTTLAAHGSDPRRPRPGGSEPE